MEKDAIVAKLLAAFPGAQIELRDLTGTKDHWQARIVAEAFAGKSMVQRHRLVNAALAEELKGPIHALTMDLKAPSEA